jgi:serine protease
VAGTIAQSTNNGIGVAGIAFRCSIMPVKALDEQGVGGAFTLARGILFAVEHGARVINLSVGSPASSRTLHDAVKTAYQRGVTVVAAAGNDYARRNRPSYPAADQDYCIGVGAVRFDLTRAPYSNTGSYVFVVAPGGDVRVDQNRDGYPDGILQQTFKTDPNSFAYWFFQGTSMAAPHVSGLAALLASHGVARPDKIREALQRTARDLGPPGWDAEYGWGLIDAYAALASRVPGDRSGDNVVDDQDLAAALATTP